MEFRALTISYCCHFRFQFSILTSFALGAKNKCKVVKEQKRGRTDAKSTLFYLDESVFEI
jgi:hypothetical protein